MNRKICIVVLGAAVVMAGSIALGASKAQTICPVMGGKINKSVYADHDGKRVYFCCPGCIGKFKASPEKFIKKLEDQGITLAKPGKPQTICPVMGGKIKKSVYADHGGKRVYFCCPGCIGKFKASPEKFIKKLESQGVTPANTPKPRDHGRMKR